jgi:formylglycine-generating enzyme required for sulfatase activity
VADATLQQAVHNRYNPDVPSRHGTLPVGSLGVNKLGLHDARGNVWEWCLDWHDSSQQARVLRGYSWYNYDRPQVLAVSYRRRNAPDVRSEVGDGFRVVLAVSAP